MNENAKSTSPPFEGRILVVAFEGWNDAGEAASSAVRTLQEHLDMVVLHVVDPETFYDFQFTRPTIGFDDSGQRTLSWPTSTFYGPLGRNAAQIDAVSPSLAEDADMKVTGTNTANIYLLQGVEPSRNWLTFANEILDVVLSQDISAIVLLGAMLADVPHTRDIPIFMSSENENVRHALNVERSSYEGPVGILSVLASLAEESGIPTLAIWASVPHYVHQGPSPKATLALIDRLEEIIDVVIPRGSLIADSTEWEASVDKLAAEDEDMTAYIAGLEAARDMVNSPEASGESLAQEFERFLQHREDDSSPPSEPPAV